MDTKWYNLGDMNYLRFGGCLVKEIAFNLFHVLKVDPESDDQGIIAVLCTVDISDETFSTKDVLYAVGLEEYADKPMFEVLQPKQWAKEFAEYYSENLFDPIYRGERVISKKELIGWMDELGVLDDIPQLAADALKEFLCPETKLTVPVPGGKIEAVKSCDPNYPGIDVEFIPDEPNGTNIRMLIESDNGKVSGHVWASEEDPIFRVN